jgi:lysophospholipase L1-like esterase
MIRLPAVASFLIPTFSVVLPADADDKLPPLEGRVLFLGDSITHDGRYISFLETFLRENAEPGDTLPELINLGLPSETLSGQSEPDHPFPRPNVHERLDRALEKIKPQLVIACYGMNDGIYHPFSEQRFAAYQDGVATLIKKVQAAGARLILLTPPPFDPQPMRDAGKLLPQSDDANYSWKTIYEDYDEKVIARYAQWILAQADRDGVAGVINLHTPVNKFVVAKRADEPSFAMSNDGVHLDEQGHRLLAELMVDGWVMAG